MLSPLLNIKGINQDYRQRNHFQLVSPYGQNQTDQVINTRGDQIFIPLETKIGEKSS